MDRRQKILATIPNWYHPLPHAIIPSALGIMLIGLCIYFISNPSWISFISVPITLFFSFGIEWLLHKYVLHKRMPLLGQIYQLHELSHHVIYTHQQMALLEKKELYFIMMPPYAILLVFCLILITSMLFFLTYEWLHFSYHQPADSLI